MATYFHVSPTLLGIGSTILPGNWGRVLKLYGPGQGNDVLYRETILEQIRSTEFPEKPSRFDAFFAVEKLEEARRYRDVTNRWALVYEVSVDIVGKVVHRGNYNFNLVARGPGGTQFAVTPNALTTHGLYGGFPLLARQYWNSNPTDDVEIVVNAPATIVRMHL